jgi:sugar/nucleoside kinase (ribokinase family)
LEILESHAPGSSGSMSVVPGESTSYTVVLSLTGKDRMFIHSTGANATFGSSDVPDDLLDAHRWLHLGYPPLLARMYADRGRGLEELFRRAKGAGLTTSLDLSLPDRDSASGRVDWEAILARVLPHVDLFVPSLGELLFMLDRESYEAGRMEGREGQLIDRAMELGARHVALKLGEQGLVLRVGDREEDPGREAPDWGAWRGQTLRQPCFKVDVAGTTGAGDATVAGLILGCLRGLNPQATCEAGAAAGACCCEKPDAISGMVSWESLKARIDAGWPQA